MKRAFVLIWLLFPVAALAWHYGPGQDQLSRDRASEHIRGAEAAAVGKDWDLAVTSWNRALDALPDEVDSSETGIAFADLAERRKIQLKQAWARIRAGQMVEGQEQLQDLLQELEDDESANLELEKSTRSELATASYYAAWLMRLEGATAIEWKPEAERARQQFRLLAERSEHGKDQHARAFKENLEATIRLEQMDLNTLRAKPLPKQCPQCKNLSQKKRKQCQSRCKSAGKKNKKGKKNPERKDARKQIKKANKAGINQRTGTGS